MKPRITDLRVHVGAHKTATSHLQKSLHRGADALAAAGVDFVRPADLRGAAASLPAWRRLLPGAAARALAEAVEAQRTGAAVLAISEEALLGEIRDVFADPPYPGLADRLGVLPRLAGGAPVHLFLSVRSFDRLWPSAHAEALRHYPPEPGRIEALRRRARQAPPRWVDLTARIRAAVPGARLQVWRQEDYSAHWPEIVAAYLGRPVPGLRPARPPRFTASPAAEGVRLAEADTRPLPPAERRAVVAPLYAAHPAGSGPVYAPFDAGEVAQLQAQYAADIAALRVEGTLVEVGAG